MDSLMKLINYMDKSEIHELQNTYIKLITEGVDKSLAINEDVIRVYSKNLNINNITVINGNYNKNKYEDTFLLDIIDIELGKYISKERKINASNVNNEKGLPTKSKLKRKL